MKIDDYSASEPWLSAAIYSTEDAEGKQVVARFISGGGVAPSGGFQKQHMIGTVQYMAPEVRAGGQVES